MDFGGGTFHIALLRLRAQAAAAGRGEVVATAGRDVGGNLVDRWVLAVVTCRGTAEEVLRNLRLLPSRPPQPQGHSPRQLRLAI